MTAEEYIKAYTRGCSNELVSVEDRCGKKVISYHEWLTPENALAAVELAREEMKKDAIEGWVARDECGDIAIFSNKPHRDLGLGMWTPSRNAFLFPRKDEYPDVTWNSEPQKVKVIIIKE
jgi:hypothetical protein